MTPNKDGLYNEQEHDWKELYNAFKNVYPLIDIEFVNFCKWMNDQVKGYQNDTK